MMISGRAKMYLEAVATPLLATAVAFGVVAVLPRGNISLVYLAAVVLVAARTSTRPALLCALVSFLAYTFFFTEPRFTLFMMHREDVVTVSFYLLMAAVTGQLAARLRRQVDALELREAISQAQLRLSERLSAAIDRKMVLDALCDALTESVASHCEQRPVDGTEDGLDNSIELGDGHDPVAAISISYRGDRAMSGEEQKALAEAMAQQAELALGRIRLTSDLHRERGAKDREVLRSALLSSVSHDLRSPLSSMLGAATSLLELRASLTPNQQHELLESILQEAERLDRYIQNLLDMTRLGGGELTLDRDWNGLDEIFNVVIKRIRPKLGRRQLSLRLSPDLPPLYVHPALIEQALFNLLENAVQFSPEDSTIGIAAREEGGSVLIDISDQGPGVPSDERMRIFDMFHTVERGDRRTAGTGLGLAICQGMIGAHGGMVEALDGPGGKGTTMRVRLPLPERQERVLQP